MNKSNNEIQNQMIEAEAERKSKVQAQERDFAPTERELLLEAATKRKAAPELKEYAKKAHRLEELQGKLEKQQAQLSNATDESDRRALRKYIAKTEQQIRNAENALTKMEAGAVLFADKDRVHALRIVGPNGETFTLPAIEKETAPEMEGVGVNAPLTRPTGVASDNSIRASSEKSNNKIMDQKIEAEAERGKTGKAHHGIDTWDYFVKKVQIDGKVFDLLANVRKSGNAEYVYSLQLNEDKSTEAAPPNRLANDQSLTRALTASDNSIHASPENNNNEIQDQMIEAEAERKSKVQAQEREFAPPMRETILSLP